VDRLISVIASLTALELKATARQASRSAIVVGGAGLLFLTCWILSVAGIVLILARGIGVVPAVFTIACFLLVTGLGLVLGKGALGSRRNALPPPPCWPPCPAMGPIVR